MYERATQATVEAALGDTPVVFIAGPRQSGKSTLAKMIGRQRRGGRYLTLDDPAVLAAARSDPAGFLHGMPDFTVLDEVQRVPELFLPIKQTVDDDRRPGRFLLTGSSDIYAVPRVADSLAGRMEVVPLWPLSQGELRGTPERFASLVTRDRFDLDAVAAVASVSGGDTDRGALARAMLRGGFPEAVARPTDARRDAFFSAYVAAVLQRDVRDLAGIDDVGQLARLFALIAARAGSTVNYTDLARSLGAPVTTVRRYVGLLEATFLVQRVPAWSANANARVIKSPKLYLTDSGLHGHQAGLTEARLAADPSLWGALLETFVVNELQKSLVWDAPRVALFHFRTQATHEVDVVLETPDGRVVGVEVKASATLTGREFAGLRHFAELAGRKFLRGVVLYMGREVLSFGKDLVALPVATVWTTGQQPAQ